MTNVFRLIILFTCVNCLTFKEFDPEIKEIKFQSNENGTKIVVSTIQAKRTLNRHFSKVDQSEVVEMGGKVFAACKESFLFKRVVSNLNEADIRLRIEVDIDMQVTQFINMLTLFTFALVPSAEEYDMRVTYSFENKEHRLLKSYKRRATYTTWLHITLLPLIFFKYNYNATNVILKEFTKSVLDEANKDGLFK